MHNGAQRPTFLRTTRQFHASLLLGAAVVVALSPAPADAQTQLERERAALGSLQEAINENEAEQETVGEQLAFSEAEVEELTRQLIETASNIQEKEEILTRLEEEILVLETEQQERLRDLDARKADLAALIGALQRLGRNPPPSLLVHPDDALAAVRGAIAMGAVMPEMRDRVDDLLVTLERLDATREGLADRQVIVREETAALDRDQVRLANLREQREQVIDAKRGELATLEGEGQTLLSEAETLETLIETLEDEKRAFIAIQKEKARVATALALRPGPPLEDGGPGQSYFNRLQGEENQEVSEVETASLPGTVVAPTFAPGAPFNEKRGKLPLPVSGRIVLSFAQSDGFGDRSSGIRIETRSGAQIIAPAGGVVSYAGPFRTYGQLLILDVGGGYHMVVAGMDAVWVDTNQTVLAGEPIGTMGSQAKLAAATNGPSVGSLRPTLYFELRRDGKAINPDPWWSNELKEADG